MAAVYILYSPSSDKYYVGSCNSLSERLQQHKSKVFTKSYTALIANDWLLYLGIDHLDYQQARAIEIHIKKMKSRQFLRHLRQYPEMIERLKGKYRVRGSFR